MPRRHPRFWEGREERGAGRARGPRSRYRHVQMEGVPPRTRYIRPMKLRPTLHDARVDRGGPVRALSSPAAHLPTPHTPSVHASLGNQFRFCPPSKTCLPGTHRPQTPTDPPPQAPRRQDVRSGNPNPISRAGQGKASWQRAPCTGTGTGTRARGQGHEQVKLLLGAAACRSMGGWWCESALPHRPSNPSFGCNSHQADLG